MSLTVRPTNRWTGARIASFSRRLIGSKVVCNRRARSTQSIRLSPIRTIVLVRLPLKLKHQRFDGDRDGAGRFEDFAEVDEVEVMEGDAVDGEDVVLEVEIVFEDVAHQSREVVVEDEVDGPAALFGQFFDSLVTPKGVIDTSAHWYYVV